MRSWVLTLCLLATAASAEMVTFPFKGVSYVSWTPGEYTSPASAQALNELKSTGANWASLLVTYYMSDKSANAMAAKVDKTPTDGDVRQAIRDMHARGLKVMLKPHVDVADGSWRGEITPTKASSWFASYSTFITKYAQIAQQEGAELYCVGCELKTLSGAGYSALWADVIAGVRAVYMGPLTYAANGSNAPDEYKTVAFWDQLDYVGVDAYFPLTSFFAPTVADLVSAWTGNRLGQNFVAEMRSFQATVGKPVLFTEIGYQSADGANSTPWYTSGSFNEAEQQKCYEAAFQVWSKEAWFQGMFWWGWSVPPTPASDTQFSARSKAAQTTLQNWFMPPPPSSPPKVDATPAESAAAQSARDLSMSSDPKMGARGIRIRGTLPVAENFAPADMQVTIESSGVERTVALNARGVARGDGITLRLALRKRGKFVISQDAPFTLEMMALSPLESAVLPVVIHFNGCRYCAEIGRKQR
jgi:hypothetical protein